MAWHFWRKLILLLYHSIYHGGCRFQGPTPCCWCCRGRTPWKRGPTWWNALEVSYFMSRRGQLEQWSVQFRGWTFIYRWWFQIMFYFHPENWGRFPILTNIVQMGWNHQLVIITFWAVYLDLSLLTFFRIGILWDENHHFARPVGRICLDFCSKHLIKQLQV